MLPKKLPIPEIPLKIFLVMLVCIIIFLASTIIYAIKTNHPVEIWILKIGEDTTEIKNEMYDLNKKLGKSIPLTDYEVLKNRYEEDVSKLKNEIENLNKKTIETVESKKYDEDVSKLKNKNQELVLQLKTVNDQLIDATEQIVNLKKTENQFTTQIEEYKERINYLEDRLKLQEESPLVKLAKSWYKRIYVLRQSSVGVTATSRYNFLNEINEIIKGLKKDFKEDSFIQNIDNCTASSKYSDDIKYGFKKLDALLLHLENKYNLDVKN